MAGKGRPNFRAALFALVGWSADRELPPRTAGAEGDFIKKEKKRWGKNENYFQKLQNVFELWTEAVYITDASKK